MSLTSSIALGVACGGVSGALSRAVVHPIDTLRVLQSVSSLDTSAALLSASEESARPR